MPGFPRYDPPGSPCIKARFNSPRRFMPKTLLACFFRNARRTQPRVLIACLVGALFSAAPSAAPRLRCQLGQGGVVQVLDFMPVTDPYRVKSVDIRENFRFKAVVIGDEQKISYIKLYTYYHSRRQPVLLHEARYLAPVVQTDANPAALTGTNTLYSPNLEREFQYACALLEVTP